MLDLGWQELMMVAFVLVLVVGPKDLPRVLRGVAICRQGARHGHRVSVLDDGRRQSG